MQKKTFGFLSFAAAALLALVGCGGGGGSSEPEIVPGSLDYKEGTELRVAGGYQKTNEAISFQDASIVGDGLTLSDGTTYHTNDLKPTWKYLKDQLKIDFKDKFTGAGSAEKEWGVWENKLSEVDIVAGSSAKLTAAGAQGKVIDLSLYLDKMPAFKYYLEQNPIARLSITGAKQSGQSGAIYFSPYFDGVDDIERMPLMRADLVRKLLDSNNETFANRQISTKNYTPYMPTSGKVDVEAVQKDGTKVILTKDYSAYGNIIQKMNEKTNLTGNEALAMFKEYIQKTYNNYYEKLSDLFLGYDAAWDADEMVALFRIAHAQLNNADGDPLVPLFSRETNNMQRDVDMFRFAGSLFGVRGMESRSDFLYFKEDGKLYDARCDAEAYRAVERMNAIVTEGLLNIDGTAASNAYLQKDAGLMSYDYNQTQTIYNDTIKYDDKTFAQSGREYVAVMVPVARWNDGSEKYMRFTESWRSVKTDGWAISAAGVGGNQDKLNAALTLIDFAFSIQGQITMSYGPDSFIKVKKGWDNTKTITKWSQVADKYETFNFNGQEMPIISDGCKTDLVKLANGNYTNFARRYLGSTLNGFPKSQAFEYQCTSETGQKGSAVLAMAIGKGIIKHPELAVNTANMWYTSVPTTLPATAAQTSLLNSYTDLTDNFKAAKNTKNVFYQIIKGGYAKSGGDTAIGPTTAEAFASFVSNDWKGSAYLGVRNAQWKTLYDFYQTL
jgi:putative aldouronate transport system substrate-binding protein